MVQPHKQTDNQESEPETELQRVLRRSTQGSGVSLLLMSSGVPSLHSLFHAHVQAPAKTAATQNKQKAEIFFTDLNQAF